MNLTKKLCVIELSTGIVNRLELGAANILVMSGTHEFTTKGKLKSFLNQQRKLSRNKRITNKLSLDTSNTEKLPSGKLHTFVNIDKNGKATSLSKHYPTQRLIVHY